MKQPQVYLAIPTHNGTAHNENANTVENSGVENLQVSRTGVSLLAHNFNTQLCAASNNLLNTHFCLLHADIGAEAGWLAKMLTLLDEHQLDVLSVVSPIKSMDKDTTSTALDTADGQRTLSLAECRALPPTFTGRHCEDVYGCDKLLINTGCMLMRLSAIDPVKHYFNIRDWIVRDGAQYHARNIPEDWDFSRKLYETGVRYGATLEVGLIHLGKARWTNMATWK